MSYILEALQKSEHARQRGKVPDLSTVPETTTGMHDHGAARHPPYIAAAFAVTLAAAVLGWWRPWHTAEPPQSPAAQLAATKAGDEANRLSPGTAPAQPPADAAPPAQAEPAVQAPRPSPTASPAAAEAPAPTPPLALNAAQPAREPLVPLSRRPEANPRKTADTAPSSAPATKAAAADKAPEPSAAASRKGSGGRILSIHELPAAVRNSLPRLNISGFAAASDSGKRMVVINDRLVQEGDEVVPGVILTSADKDSVVLDFQGYRFRAQP